MDLMSMPLGEWLSSAGATNGGYSELMSVGVAGQALEKVALVLCGEQAPTPPAVAVAVWVSSKESGR